MCTVTRIPLGGASRRIVCNRDERRTRTAALPPRTQRFGQHAALLPIDPASQGTWIGVSGAGLAMVLLNRNLRHADHWQTKTAVQQSRGKIIPAALAADSIDQAEQKVRALDPADFALFRLLLDDGQTVRELVSDGQTLSRLEHATDAPLLFTSSGLGDDLVDPPRRALFEKMLAGGSDTWIEAQQTFHAHRWGDRPELSVDMQRDDARTVSVTTLDVADETATMTYASDDVSLHHSELRFKVSAA